MTETMYWDRQPVAELVRRAEVAVLTTMTQEGQHISRPMALQEADFDGDLWFFADEDSAKVAHIRTIPEVNVFFTDTEKHSWTSIAGRAYVVHDRQRAKQLYSPTLDAWFPVGLETPGLTLIRVEVETAEYWAGPTDTAAWVAGRLWTAGTREPGNDPVRDDTVEL